MVIDALQKLGPCISTKLAEHLVADKGISPIAARQRISRSINGSSESNKSIHKLNLQFQRDAHFLYLRDQYNTSIYWRNLYKCIAEERGAYAFAVEALRVREAIPI